MKRVYDTSEVFHLWANRAVKHDIRNRSGNVSTRNCGAVLCSYGEHYALAGYLYHPKRDERILIVNTAGYSATTAGHKSDTWRALPGFERDKAIHVDGLRASDFRGLSTLPKMAESNVRQARERLEKSDKARTNRPYLIQSARDWIADAAKLYEFCGDKRAAAALPAIPADADKATIAAIVAAIVAAIGKAEFLQHARVALERARQSIDRAESRVAEYRVGNYFGYRKPACAVLETAREAVKDAESVRAFYLKAQTKPAPEVARIFKRAGAIIGEVSQAADIETRNEYADDIRDRVRQSFLALHRENQHARRHGKKAARNHWRIMRHVGQQMIDEFRYKGDTSVFPVDCIDSARRFSRKECGDRLRDCIAAVSNDIAQHRAKPEQYGVPGLAGLNNAMRDCRRYAPELMETGHYLATRADAIAREVGAMIAAHAAIVAARNAEKIQQWRNGERVYLPNDLPTMARIVGDTVETSRGARVPLEHAMRLVRIAERVASRGGNDWKPGEGPIVGHFRVTHIGADMSAIIGCHEFTPDESKRAITVIKAHPAYLAVTAE